MKIILKETVENLGSVGDVVSVRDGYGRNFLLPRGLAVVVYFLQGLAVIDHLFQARGFPRPLRALTYTLLFLQLPIALLVATLGAFDLWADFRARWSPPPPTKSVET